MFSPSLLLLVHLAGLALGLGAATAKVVLLLRCRADSAFVPAYLAIVKPITRQVILGLVLLLLSGIGFMVIGHSFTPRLVRKLVLVAAIFVIGPVIDNVIEPRFRALAPRPGAPASPEFVRVLTQYLALDVLAGGLFWAVVVLWVMF
jgi:hypothetical protein